MTFVGFARPAGSKAQRRRWKQSRSCSLNIFEFLRVAQPLRPRYYSASSSPRVHGAGVIQLTVGLEAAPAPGGRQFRGMGSHYLHTLREGDRLNVFLDGADGFRLQQDMTKPMIFIAAGTGLAGVERRLATFDGILAVSSPPGGPTIIVIEVPCALSSAKTSSC